MVRSQLNSYSGADPIWGFVALIGSERFTGEAAVGVDPRLRLFAVDGRVYFAERDGDLPVGSRLVNCGAVTATQLELGSVRVGDTDSLARLFQRQPMIDRDAVELTIELATEAWRVGRAHESPGGWWAGSRPDPIGRYLPYRVAVTLRCRAHGEQADTRAVSASSAHRRGRRAGQTPLRCRRARSSPVRVFDVAGAGPAGSVVRPRTGLPRPRTFLVA